MSNYLFDFLQELDPELVKIAHSIEKNFFDDPHGVLVKARLFAELMTKRIAEFENMNHLLSFKQVDRVRYLDREGIFTKEVGHAFDTIRTIGNRASHESIKDDLELALKVHKNVFIVAVWFREVYGGHDFIAPAYKYPEIRKNEVLDEGEITRLIESTLSKQLSELLQNKKNNSVTEESTAVNEFKDDDPEISSEEISFEGKQFHNSYLLNELSKLKESSQEAVEGSDAFSNFKNYLHVDRPIQEDLIDALKEARQSNSSELIFLCGSVGDGKSHLLAYMNQVHPELMEGIQIHNDATESFDPQKNSLDTLAEVLKSFSDENVSTSNEKLILAINLGVLHNFLESDYAKESYTKLTDFINKSKIFETDFLSENYYDTNFKLISFSDYHPYELTKDGPKSNYFTKLLEKIAQPASDNPFYMAYTRDLENGVNAPFMKNYRLLQKEAVREKISNKLIMVIVQYKHIISTRSYLNFIHNIIVPASSEEYILSTSVIEDTEALLPNLIFNSPDRSPLLKVFSQLDPINLRSDKIDEMLIQLNNSNNVTEVFQQYLELDELNDWIQQLSELGAYYDLLKPSKQILNATLIRFGYFLGKEIQKEYTNKTYEKYTEYLFNYNVGESIGLKHLYLEVEEAVFAWKGKPKPNSSYIFIEESSRNMNIAQSLNIRRYAKHLVKREQAVLHRFKNTITIGFQDENKQNYALLEIDYPLYKTLLKILKGYRPNKKDKEEAIQFVEFIEKLLKLSKKENELIVYDNTENLLFKLEYDEDFEEFSFKRE